MRDLEALGIEYSDRERYVTRCPQCAQTRRKHNTKSLCVWRFKNKIYFKCQHADACLYNQTQSVWASPLSYTKYLSINKGTTMFLSLPEYEVPPIPSGAILYKYFEASEAKFYVCRTEDKRFIPFAWTNEGWVSRRPPVKSLYRSEYLDKLAANESRPLRPVIVVEGEKAANAAAEIFTSADVVSWVGGASNVTAGDWDLLKGRNVTIWPDNDEPGINAAHKIAKLIDSPEVYIIDTSSLPPKADLADNLGKEVIQRLFRTRTKISGPVVRGLYNIKNLVDDLTKTVEGLPFGFSEMDSCLRLPSSGLAVIEGRTNHGKSACMINVAMNLLKKTNAVVLYVSYEIPSKDTHLKMVKCIEGTEYAITNLENNKIYLDRIKNNDCKGYDELMEYVNNERLLVTDEPLTAEEVCKTMQRLKRMGVPVVVFLDYVQIMPTDNRTQRYLAIKHNVETLRAEAHKLNTLVIVGSQLTNGENPFADKPREGGDINYSAELVLKVWNKIAALNKGTYMSRKTADGEKKIDYYDDVPGKYVIHVMKTRQGSADRKFGFNLVNGIKFEEAPEVAEYSNKYDVSSYYK